MEFLRRKDIDTDRWDAVIDSSATGLPYAYSAVLDECCNGKWDAIVGDAYNYVLPLPFNRKLFGFKQYYQPYLLQQLGVFGNMPASVEMDAIIHMIKSHSIRSMIAFQEENTQLLAGAGGNLKTNFVLDLLPGYDYISNQYKKNLKQRIGRSFDDEFTGSEGLSMDDAIDMYFQWTYAKYNKSEKLSKRYIHNWVRIFNHIGYAHVVALRAQDATIHSGIIYLKTHSRIILSLQFSHPDYKQYSGPSRLIDYLIRQHAGSRMRLDFEGSQIPSIAEFYGSFTPQNMPYTVIKS